MSFQRILVVAEKPVVGQRIAQALSADCDELSHRSGVIEVTSSFDGIHYVVCSALGHLYQLSDCCETREVFPVMDTDWFPREESKTLRRKSPALNGLIKKKILDIKNLSSGCSKFVNACDLDTEGETIGFNALVFASGDGSSSHRIFRAKFSTLTVEEIRDSFRKLFPEDIKLAKAGRMRHLTDFIWGVNLSRALTLSHSYHGGKGRVALTIGRVQGPTLAFVVERELDRRAHVPVPTWIVSCSFEKDGFRFAARSVDSPFKRKSSAEKVYRAALSSREARVKKIEGNTHSVPPRYPFDLGELQREAHKFFKISPSFTLSIAQKLYEKALISYPRTESQKLPEKIGPSKILESLSLQPAYSFLITRLLADPKKRHYPIEGPNVDSAHSSMYPTGENPKSDLSAVQKKIFDLIVKRFCNCFASDLVLEKTTVEFHVSYLDFTTHFSTIRDEGWTEYYPYYKYAEASLKISLAEGEAVKLISAAMEQEYEKMPSRFTEVSLLTKMEDGRIGTKATRAEIITTLLVRRYLEKKGSDLAPTELGSDVVEKIRDVSSGILSTSMTRILEEKMEMIKMGGENEIDYILEVFSSIRPVMKAMVHSGIEINGLNSVSSLVPFENGILLGECPSCRKGQLELIRSVRTKKRFIKCTNSLNGCTASSPAFPRGSISPLDRRCLSCGWPIVSCIFKGRRSAVCSNFNCTKLNSN